MKKKLQALSGKRLTDEEKAFLASVPANVILEQQDSLLLSKWNKLHNAPAKRRDFTFVLRSGQRRIIKYLTSNFPTNRDKDGNILADIAMPLYAYIYHNQDLPKNIDDLKDNPEAGCHYHFYVEFSSPRSFYSVADEFGLPVTSLEPVKSSVGILEYLTHENNPEKHHYSPDDVICNFDLSKEIKARKDWNFDTLMDDYFNLRRGRIGPQDFLLKYKTYIVRHCSFAQQIRLMGEIYDKSFKK